jgi:hypothetical protein
MIFKKSIRIRITFIFFIIYLNHKSRSVKGVLLFLEFGGNVLGDFGSNTLNGSLIFIAIRLVDEFVEIKNKNP